MSRHAAEFRVALWTMGAFGAFDMIRGVSAPQLQAGFRLDYGWLGLLFSVSSLGYLLSSLASGLLVKRLGIKRVLMTGVGILLSGMVGIVSAWNYASLAVSFLLAGAGVGAMEIGTNSLVPHVAGNRQSKYFNVLHALYGVGAFVSPIAAGWAIRMFHLWRLPYFGVGVLFLAIALAASGLGYPGRDPDPADRADGDARNLPVSARDASARAAPGSAGGMESGPSEAGKAGAPLFRTPTLYLLLFAITVYVAAEAGVGAWLPLLLRSSRGISVAVGAFYVAGFYLLFTLGRFVGSVVVERVGSVRAIAAAAVTAAAALGAAEFGPSGWLPLFAGAGFFFGTIFPTLSAVASESFPQDTGTVIGLLFTGAGVGSMASSWAIGNLANHFGMRAGFFLIVICLLATAASIVAFHLFERRANETRCEVA